jgi:hypothetical protein
MAALHDHPPATRSRFLRPGTGELGSYRCPTTTWTFGPARLDSRTGSTDCALTANSGGNSRENDYDIKELVKTKPGPAKSGPRTSCWTIHRFKPNFRFVCSFARFHIAGYRILGFGNRSAGASTAPAGAVVVGVAERTLSGTGARSRTPLHIANGMLRESEAGRRNLTFPYYRNGKVRNILKTEPANANLLVP